jgi:hypothetical protein
MSLNNLTNSVSSGNLTPPSEATATADRASDNGLIS